MSPRWLLLCTGAVALVPQTPLARRSVTLSAKAGTFPAYENPKKGALGAKSLLPDEADAVVQAAPAPAPPPPPPPPPVEKVVEKPVAKPVAKAVAPAPSPAPGARPAASRSPPARAFAVLAGVVAWRAKATEEESAEEPTPAPKLAYPRLSRRRARCARYRRSPPRPLHPRRLPRRHPRPHRHRRPYRHQRPRPNPPWRRAADADRGDARDDDAAAAPVKKADLLPAKKDGPVLTPASASPVKKAAAVMPVVTALPKAARRDDAGREAAAAEAAKQAAEAVEKFDAPRGHEENDEEGRQGRRHRRRRR
ncbi:hypothetical protein JL720_9495 [Aureococcus anophagefferens]|nr:hypothetical protein JL720_9495 [Aureococcus anophagefferens]